MTSRTGSFLEPASPLWSSRALGLLRIVVGVVFVTYGTTKLFGVPAGPTPNVPVTLFSERGLAGILETVGGTLITIGFLTRPVAFLLCGEMAVAYFQVHFPRSLYPTVNAGVSALLFCFIYMYVAVAGPGAWSVDARVTGRRAGDTTG